METAPISTQLGRDDFMQLLVTQMRNQNPLDPVKGEQFLAQLAQFSTLEAIQKLNGNFEDMLRLEQITQGAGLIGRTALYEHPERAVIEQGVVQGIRINDGTIQLIIEGADIPLAQVRGLMETEATP